MRKLLRASCLAFALMAGGCSGFSNLANFAVVGVENPLTQREYNIALRGFKAALNPTVAYIELRTCRLSEGELASWATSSPCADYGRKLAAQDALRVADQYHIQMRDFVKQNRMVDARVAYNELMKAVAIMRSYKKGATP